MSVVEKRRNLRLGLAWLVFLSALFLPVWFMAAALGSKFEIWNWQFGLGVMTFDWGPKLAMGILALSALGLILGLIKAPRIKTVILCLVAALVAGLILGRMAGFREHAMSLPAIHDIQTDWSDPVQFSEALMDIRGDSNPVLDNPTYGEDERLVSEAQADAYPDIRSLITRAPAEIAYAAAFTTLSDMGFEIVTANEAEGMLEATETSFWYGFKDDVAIRIRSQGEGSQIDIRSVSRVGRSDLGMNANRIGNLLTGINTSLDIESRAGASAQSAE